MSKPTGSFVPDLGNEPKELIVALINSDNTLSLNPTTVTLGAPQVIPNRVVAVVHNGKNVNITYNRRIQVTVADPQFSGGNTAEFDYTAVNLAKVFDGTPHLGVNDVVLDDTGNPTATAVWDYFYLSYGVSFGDDGFILEKQSHGNFDIVAKASNPAYLGRLSIICDTTLASRLKVRLLNGFMYHTPSTRLSKFTPNPRYAGTKSYRGFTLGNIAAILDTKAEIPQVFMLSGEQPHTRVRHYICPYPNRPEYNMIRTAEDGETVELVLFGNPDEKGYARIRTTFPLDLNNQDAKTHLPGRYNITVDDKQTIQTTLHPVGKWGDAVIANGRKLVYFVDTPKDKNLTCLDLTIPARPTVVPCPTNPTGYYPAGVMNVGKVNYVLYEQDNVTMIQALSTVDGSAINPVKHMFGNIDYNMLSDLNAPNWCHNDRFIVVQQLDMSVLCIDTLTWQYKRTNLINIGAIAARVDGSKLRPVKFMDKQYLYLCADSPKEDSQCYDIKIPIIDLMQGAYLNA